MIASSGRTIPDPPSDPEERRRWKIIYADLYGTPPDVFRKRLAKEMEIARQRRRAMRRTIWIGVLSFVGGMCLAQGAAHDWWRLETLGIVLLGLALGTIVHARIDWSWVIIIRDLTRRRWG